MRRVNTPGDEVLALEGAPPGLEPEQQVLDTLGAEELTRMILDLREPYKTPCRLVLLEQHTMAEAARLCGRPEKNRERADLPGQKDAGTADPGTTGREERTWNCLIRTDA